MAAGESYHLYTANRRHGIVASSLFENFHTFQSQKLADFFAKTRTSSEPRLQIRSSPYPLGNGPRTLCARTEPSLEVWSPDSTTLCHLEFGSKLKLSSPCTCLRRRDRGSPKCSTRPSPFSQTHPQLYTYIYICIPICRLYR